MALHKLHKTTPSIPEDISQFQPVFFHLNIMDNFVQISLIERERL